MQRFSKKEEEEEEAVEGYHVVGSILTIFSIDGRYMLLVVRCGIDTMHVTILQLFSTFLALDLVIKIV